MQTAILWEKLGFLSLFLTPSKGRCQNSRLRIEKSFREMCVNGFYYFCGKSHVINPGLTTGITSHNMYVL